MYCRKCGAKLNEKAKFCDSCGEEVIIVKQRSDVDKYRAKLAQDEAKAKQLEQERLTRREKKLAELNNPYVIPAFGTSIIAFALGIFPWPASWHVGTSTWMSILIIIIALLSSYHSRKARQVNTAYQLRYRYEVKPKLVKVATLLSSITVLVALFALLTK